MGPEQFGDGGSEGSAERAIWRLSCGADVPEDEETRLLDLAGYTDGLLDDDESERVAAWLATRPEATADVAAARMLATGIPALDPNLIAATIARAQALHPASDGPKSAQVILFPSAHRVRRGWQMAASWASLAAALLVASWLGFTLGTDASRDLGQLGQSSDDSYLLRELFDPSTGVLRDVTEGIQT